MITTPGPEVGWLAGGVAAVLHTPATAAAHTGVVLVPPFGWEDVASYRVRREWAESLAASGYAVLRLDLPGTGDSAGETDRPDLLAVWATAVVDGAAALRAAGCGRVAVLGLGLGGVVACLAAQDPQVDDVALWAVPSRGRAVVRQLRVAADRPEASAGASDGDLLWLFGYPLPAAALAELEGLDLSLLPLARPGRRVLLLGRDGIGPEPRFVTALEASGLAVTTGPGHGYAALVEHPQTSTPSRTVWSQVTEWLGPWPAAGTTVRQPSASSLGGLSAGPITVAPGTTERHVVLRTTCGPVMGVVTEPAQSVGLGLVMMGAGATRRTGPNRLNVQAARAAAARGVTTLRFDQPGVGDSPGPSTWASDNTAFYDDVRLGQARAVLAALGQVGIPERLVLAGLCSGAYWSFVLAAEDPHVVGVGLFNPRALAADAVPGLVPPPRWGLLTSPTTWRRLVKDAGARRRAVAQVRAGLSRLSNAVRSSEPEVSPVERGLDVLAARCTSVLLAFESADREILVDLRARGCFDQPDRWPGLELHVLDGPSGVNTSFAPAHLQRGFLRLVVSMLAQHGALPFGASAQPPTHA